MEPEPVARLVAARVRRLRRERGWSAEQLAKECGPGGPTRSTIAKIESGVRKSVSAEEITALARALEVSPSELMATGTDDEAEQEPTAGSLQPVVEALLRLPTMKDPVVRKLAGDLMRRRLGAGFDVPEQPTVRLYLYGLVVACEAHPYGLQTLLSVVTELEDDPFVVEPLRRAIAALSVVGLLSAPAHDELAALLAARAWPRVAEDFRAAAGPYVPDPGGLSAEEYATELAQLNAPPSGIPPVLTFVERLAARAEPELAEQLRAWHRKQAARLGAPDPTPAPDVPAGLPGAYLMIMVEPQGDNYHVRTWHQLSTNDLRPDQEFTGPLSTVRRHVTELVADAEEGWAAAAEFIRLEFVLPRELLSLPVDQWDASMAGELPQPLGLRHQVVVRSLDRMLTPRWHRAWRLRWLQLEQLDRQESLTGKELVVWEPPSAPAELRQIDARLAQHDGELVMVLGHEPRPSPDGDEVFVGLRAGLPVMLWLRDGRFADSFESEVHTMLTAGRDLPEAARLLRGRAFSATDPETHVGSHVTLLWDDPHRVVNLSGPRPMAKDGR